MNLLTPQKQIVVNGSVLEQLTQFRVRTKHLYLNWVKLVNQVDNYSVFSQFQKFVKQHDQYRKLNFAQVFPEMAHCI